MTSKRTRPSTQQEIADAHVRTIDDNTVRYLGPIMIRSLLQRSLNFARKLLTGRPTVNKSSTVLCAPVRLSDESACMSANQRPAHPTHLSSVTPRPSVAYVRCRLDFFIRQMARHEERRGHWGVASRQRLVSVSTLWDFPNVLGFGIGIDFGFGDFTNLSSDFSCRIKICINCMHLCNFRPESSHLLTVTRQHADLRFC